MDESFHFLPGFKARFPLEKLTTSPSRGSAMRALVGAVRKKCRKPPDHDQRRGDELSFTNRIDRPARQQIIQQETIIPESLDEKFVTYFPFSCNTGTEWSLLLVPVAGGLQVWQHRDGWHQAQFIERAVETHLHPSIANAGYTRSFDLSLSLGDVNGDARDDLIVMRNSAAGAQIYSLTFRTPKASSISNLR